MTAQRRSSRGQAGKRLKDATVALGRKCKRAVHLTPEQQKVFAVTLVTVLLSGGGLGTLMDKIRTAEYNEKFEAGTNNVTALHSNMTALQEANGAIQTQLQQAQEALQTQITAQAARIEGVEKEPTTIRQEFEALKGEIAGFQSAWEKKQNHEHKFGDWEDPIQIQGNFTTPQFFQYRKCLICGQTDARTTW